MGWGVSVTHRSLSTPGKDPVTIAQEAGWAPGPVWTTETFVPPGFDPRTVQLVVIRYTDSYSAHILFVLTTKASEFKFQFHDILGLHN
jgi:hypothetical protein